MKNKMRRFLVKGKWVIVASTVLGSHFAADACMEGFEWFFHKNGWPILYLGLFYISFFICMVYLLIKLKGILFPLPRTRYLHKDKAGEREHLVLFLSKLNQRLNETKGIPEGLQLSEDIDEDILSIKALEGKIAPWPWEMSLRAIRHHFKKLKTLTLICSPESVLQLEDFLNICKRYQYPRLGNIYSLACENEKISLVDLWQVNDINSVYGFDFESFDHMVLAMDSLTSIFNKKKYPEHEIMVDVTGGQKPNSIVGATMTFNRKLQAQYISTNDLDKVLAYDIILDGPDTGELTM